MRLRRFGPYLHDQTQRAGFATDDSHVDVKYKKSLVLTMLNRAFRLSSSWKLFTEECERLKRTFVRLRYPVSLLDNIITKYTAQKRESDDRPAQERNINENVVRVMLPFKDQKSADSVRRQLRNLSKTIGRQIQPVYTSRKIAADFPAAETKPPLVNQQCVVYLLASDEPGGNRNRSIKINAQHNVRKRAI